MKTSIAKLALGLTVMSLSSVAMAGIADTKHNLGGTGTANFTDATTEICVFCHTPHGADSSAAVPLWNRTLSAGSTYNTYASLGTSTLDSASTEIGSVSLACLSCHDGTQAMDVMLNTPGSGTTFTLGAGSNASGPNGWVEFNQMSVGDVSTEPIYLGTDLRNDHPISIQYAGALTNGDSHNRAYKDQDFNAATATSVSSGTTVYYIETGANSDNATVKDKHDLPLYNRVGGTLTGEPLVECATCHDPHTTTTTFLRNKAGNDTSATCLSCHVK